MIIKQKDLFDIKNPIEQEILFDKSKMPILSQFDKVYISCSGGKDSQAMAILLVELAENQKYPKSKMVLLYADTGFEWHDTYKHVESLGGGWG